MKVLITGITGQDGSNFIEYLLNNTDHELYGTVRSLSNPNHVNIKSFINNKRVKILVMDLTDENSVKNIFKQVMPDYFINLAAQSYVGESWNQPKLTFMVNSISLINILELIRDLKPSCKFYSAGSSEEFGNVEFVPQTLDHPLKPRSPYGASKCCARHIVKVYRESYNLFAIHCILFNHEGIKRGKQFVTRKITHNLAKIKHQLENNITPDYFELGNIYTKRDWSDSEDFVEAIWLMLNKDKPKEYILSSNQTHSIVEFIDLSAKYLNLDLKWHFSEDPLKTYATINDHIAIKISEKYYRPAEVDLLQGDSLNTYKELNWEPKITFEDMVKRMVEHDYNLFKLNNIN